VEEARRQLEVERAALVEFSSLIALLSDPLPCSEILLSSMDDDAQPPQPPPASPEWMVWLVQQLELDPAQVGVLFKVADLGVWISVCRLYLCLTIPYSSSPLSIPPTFTPTIDQEEVLYYLGRLSQFRRENVELAKECTETVLAAADVLDESLMDDSLEQIMELLGSYQFYSGVYMLAVYASCLRADQLAVYLCSAWPFLPSLSGLHAALALIRERGAAQQKQQQQKQQKQRLAC